MRLRIQKNRWTLLKLNIKRFPVDSHSCERILLSYEAS